MPIMVHPEQAEVHILEDEAASRDYFDMMWAEAMFIYVVRVHFNEDAKETMADKIKRMLREEVRNM